MSTQTYRPRDMRSKFLGHIAYSGAKQAGKSAMDAACARIDAEFGNAAIINDFKLRVERVILFGPTHPAIRARYGKRAEMLMGMSLIQALFVVDRLYRTEQKAFKIASALGRGNRLSLEVLHELRLIFRWFRATGRSCWFQSIVSDVLAVDP